jgi:hypothetical protein
MRRGVGIGALNRQTQQKERFKKVGETMAAEEMTRVCNRTEEMEGEDEVAYLHSPSWQMTEQMSLFKQNLESFALKYKKQINLDPEFRKYFQVMCASIGVDPLACKSSSLSTPCSLLSDLCSLLLSPPSSTNTQTLTRVLFLSSTLFLPFHFFPLSSKQRFLGRVTWGRRFLL